MSPKVKIDSDGFAGLLDIPYDDRIDILGPRLSTQTWRARYMYEESKMASSTGKKTKKTSFLMV